MAREYSRILRAITEQPWAIRQSMMDTICEVVMARANGAQLTKDEIQARLGISAARPVKQIVGTVAVLPVTGVLSQKMNMFTEISGGTSYQQLTMQFREFRDDPQVKAIVFEHDSPGGDVTGLEELAEEIFEARGSKRMIAAVNPFCASASLYLAVACDEVVVTPSGMIGSIGTIIVHGDYSKMNEALGFKPTYITSSKYKAEANEDEPLGDEAYAMLKAMADDYGARFEKFVARGRGVDVSVVREQFGQGRMLMAKQAVKVGLADRIATFDQVIAKLVGRAPSAGAKAEGDAAPTVRAEAEALPAGEAVDPQIQADIDYAAAAVAIAERQR